MYVRVYVRVYDRLPFVLPFPMDPAMKRSTQLKPSSTVTREERDLAATQGSSRYNLSIGIKDAALTEPRLSGRGISVAQGRLWPPCPGPVCLQGLPPRPRSHVMLYSHLAVHTGGCAMYRICDQLFTLVASS